MSKQQIAAALRRAAERMDRAPENNTAPVARRSGRAWCVGVALYRGLDFDGQRALTRPVKSRYDRCTTPHAVLLTLLVADAVEAGDL